MSIFFGVRSLWQRKLSRPRVPAHAYTQRHHRPEALGLYLCCRLPGDLYMQPCIFSLPRQVLLHCKELASKFPGKKRYFSVASWGLVAIANCFFYKKGLMVRSMGVLRILFIPCVCPRAPNSPQNAPPAGSSSKSEESGQPKQTPQCHTKKQSHQQRPDKNNISRAE